jgi:hypothetical protein
MKRKANVIFLTTVVAIVGLIAGSAITRSCFVAEMPSIPETVTPRNGAVTEYWPNRIVRSERLYRNGEIQEAVYYSSAGSIVFEMSSDSRD